MTDKEIIIDGVNVNKCEYFDEKEYYTCTQDNCFQCDESKDCYYKQLQREKQKNEELISQLDFTVQKLEVAKQKNEEWQYNLKETQKNLLTYKQNLGKAKKKIIYYKQVLKDIGKIAEYYENSFLDTSNLYRKVMYEFQPRYEKITIKYNAEPAKQILQKVKEVTEC